MAADFTQLLVRFFYYDIPLVVTINLSFISLFLCAKTLLFMNCVSLVENITRDETFLPYFYTSCLLQCIYYSIVVRYVVPVRSLNKNGHVIDIKYSVKNSVTAFISK